MKLAIVSSGAALALLGASASSDAGRPPALLHADVAEWSIVPSVGTVAAGSVRISVRNLGTASHEVAVVRTSTFAARLRVDGAHATVPNVVGRIVVAPGHTASFTVSLRRGSYLLVDNLPWHYWKGTSAAFSVR